MTDREATKSFLRELFDGQRLAVLATCEGDGHPFANLMAFAASDDLRSVSLVTDRATRKYATLRAHPRVALLIDSRDPGASDFNEMAAVTIVGEAEEVSDDGREGLLELFVAQHPYLAEFVSSPSSALFRVNVVSYYLVRRFQEVTELHFRE